MSEHRLLSIIRSQRRLARRFNRLTEAGRRRVIEIANGDDFMLADIIDDVLDDERHAK